MPKSLLALCALSAQLGLSAAVSRRAVHEPSATEFFRASRYAFVRFDSGEAVEAKGKDGSWVRCTVISRGGAPNSYNVHVPDAAGGYALPCVPSQMLRRLLEPGERDFYVDNSILNHSGSGIKYRNAKRLEAKGDDYAPWGTVVSGTDEHDGWVRISLLQDVYLPTVIQGHKVLVPIGRDGPSPLSPAETAARSAGARLDLAARRSEYTPGDSVKFRTKAGDWFPARITGAGSLPDTYRIVVMASESASYPIDNVAADSLKREAKEAAAATPPPRTQNELPPSCQNGGCITVSVKTSKGRDFVLHISTRSRVDMLMKMVCNKVRIAWEDCQARTRFTFQDRELSPWTHVDSSGLDNNAVVLMEELPAVEAPVDNL